MFKFNETLDLHYPSTTLINSVPTYRPRRFAVRGVRDLVANPLTVQDYLRRPLIHRGRWLILARDLETGELRQFYLSTTKEEFRPLPMRIGLYEPGANRPLELVSRPFAPTVHDRILLARAAQKWSRQLDPFMRLGIFADDLRLVKR